jgi:hypothetical protein
VRRRRKKTTKTGAAPASVRSVLTAGVLAGIAAAAAIVFVRAAVVLSVLLVTWRLTRSWHGTATRAVRRELWAALKVTAYARVGDRALEPGFDARTILQSLAILLGLTIWLGVTFALLAYGRSRKLTFALGLLFGIGAWIVDWLYINPLPGNAIAVIPSGLAMACAVLWYQSRVARRQ